MLNSSQAFEIVEFPSDTEDYSYGGYTYHSAYLKTDVPFYSVLWYVDGNYTGYTYGGHEKTEARFSPNPLPGSIKGVKYTIKAEVNWIEDDGTTQTDADSYVVRMFESKNIFGTKYPPGVKRTGTGIYGSVQLSRHYHDGQNIVVEGHVYARNGTKKTCHAVSWFRHTEFGGNGWSKQDPDFNEPNPATPMAPGETYSNSGSSSISYPVGGDIGRDQKIKLNAHIHLDVSGAVWHEEGGAWTHTFDYKDNRDYQDDQ